MAWKLKRNQKITEKLELDDGQIITIELDIPKMIKQFTQGYNAILRLKVKGAKINNENIESYYNELGEAFINLMNIVFGEDNANKILNYYDDNFIACIDNVVPFIEQVINPHFKNYNKEKMKQIKKYKG